MSKKKSLINKITQDIKQKNISGDMKSNEYVQVKSIDGYNCIGPCYPPNTIYYNPLTLTPIKSKFPSCPIKEVDIVNGGKVITMYADKCNEADISNSYINFDIFSDYVQIAKTSDLFLKQLYGITNISEAIIYLNSSIDTIPIYSQRRLLKAIFEVYWKYVEFPKIFFSKKLVTILKQIYKISHNFDENQIISDLNTIDSKSYDIYRYFLEKYL
jgi:hypothetical protein